VAVPEERESGCHGASTTREGSEGAEEGGGGGDEERGRREEGCRLVREIGVRRVAACGPEAGERGGRGERGG